MSLAQQWLGIWRNLSNKSCAYHCQQSHPCMGASRNQDLAQFFKDFHIFFYIFCSFSLLHCALLLIVITNLELNFYHLYGFGRQPSCDCFCCSSPPASPVRIPSLPSQLCVDQDVRAAVHSTRPPFMPPPEPDPDLAALHATFTQSIYSTSSAFTKHLPLPSSSLSSLVLAPTATGG